MMATIAMCIQYWIGTSQCNRHENNIKGIQTGKEEVQVTYLKMIWADVEN